MQSLKGHMNPRKRDFNLALDLFLRAALRWCRGRTLGRPDGGRGSCDQFPRSELGQFPRLRRMLNHRDRAFNQFHHEVTCRAATRQLRPSTLFRGAPGHRANRPIKRKPSPRRRDSPRAFSATRPINVAFRQHHTLTTPNRPFNVGVVRLDVASNRDSRLSSSTSFFGRPGVAAAC